MRGELEAILVGVGAAKAYFPILLFAVACAPAPASAPAGTAASREDAVVAAPAPSASGAGAARPAERVALSDLMADPEAYLAVSVVVHGWMGVCPNLCDGTKFRCGTVAPSEGRCTGHVALAFEQPPGSEVRCAPGADRAQNALVLRLEDERFACLGHCGKWSCPAVNLGGAYVATARLERFLDAEGRPRYGLVSSRLTKLDSTDAGAGPTAP